MSLRRRLVPALAALASAALIVPLVQGSAAAAPSPVNGYIALGDSVPDAYGVKEKEGYVRLLSDALGGLPTRNASISGATTTSLIEQQLPRVLPSIQARNSNKTPVDDVRLITVTIGGNDVFRPVVDACSTGPGETCASAITTGLMTVAQNYGEILAALRQAAGEDATIAVMTYYNSIVGACPLAAVPGFTALADQVLEGGALVPVGMNQIIRQVAGAFDAVVVETGEVVGPQELVGDCLHPNAAGHVRIADAFADAVSIDR
jgi:lysophospholipase L1-like esterase